MVRHPDRYFDPDPTVRGIARKLYETVAELPLVCPHGHVDPAILAGDIPFPNPAALLVIPDHYLLRMLYSQGVPLERLGVPRLDGGPVETDPRKIWMTFAERFLSLSGHAVGLLARAMSWPASSESKSRSMRAPPGASTTRSARSWPSRSSGRARCSSGSASRCCVPRMRPPTRSSGHRKIRESGWKGRVLPTFRPDAAVAILAPSWPAEIEKLGALAGKGIASFGDYIAALENRRAFFKSMGAVSTDHAVVEPYTEELPAAEAGAIFARALRGRATEEDARRFTAHMLVEFARMSTEDGLVMQLHAGSWRNHNRLIYETFGADQGLRHPRRDASSRATCGRCSTSTETIRTSAWCCSRWTSPLTRASWRRLAGHYPAVRLGPPVVVPRQHPGHAPVPGTRDRDGRHLEHGGLQ